MRRLAAVALVINSPGGSPAQSALICNRIRALAAEKKKPVYAFTEDVAASGGYWLACAADEIYANETRSSDRSASSMAASASRRRWRKLGIERRLYTAGDKKSILDPFLPQKEADVKRVRSLHKELHENFKSVVRERRGARLKGGPRTLFSGEFWTGSAALELGLIDGIGDLRSVMREKCGDKVQFRMLMRRQSLLSMMRRDGGRIRSRRDLGGDIAAGLIAAAEDRLLWNRYGL